MTALWLLALGIVHVVCISISSFILLWAWNTVLAGLFGAPEIMFWHAVGIVMIIGFIGNTLCPRSSGSKS